MTEKRYMIEEIGNMFRVLKDNEPLTTKFENTDKIDVINLVEELNNLHEVKETYKSLWEQMAYYFPDNGKVNSFDDLDHKDFYSLQRLAKGLVD